jgi:FtsZ-interacting cell division protein ZipA
MHHVLAYVDPGSGSLIVQGAIAVAAGVASSAYMVRRRISNVFRSKKNDRSEETRTESSENTRPRS